MLTILLLVYSIFGSLGMTLIKKGGCESTISRVDENISINLNYRLSIGIILYIVSFLLWIFILQLFPIVYISPIAYGINFIFIAFFASFVLKEKVRVMELIGVASIIIGVILVSIKF